MLVFGAICVLIMLFCWCSLLLRLCFISSVFITLVALFY
jgi:hypothetical protein